MALNNKEKNTRIVTFLEDYTSKAGKAIGEPPIYKKGSTHAIQYQLLEPLKAKGAKFKDAGFDIEAAKKRRKKELADNRKKALSN